MQSVCIPENRLCIKLFNEFFRFIGYVQFYQIFPGNIFGFILKRWHFVDASQAFYHNLWPVLIYGMNLSVGDILNIVCYPKQPTFYVIVLQ